MHRIGAMVVVVVVVVMQMGARGVLTWVTVNTAASQAAMFRFLASCCCFSCCYWQDTIKIMRLMPTFVVRRWCDACCSIVLISSCSVLFDFLSKMSRFGTK